MPVVSVSRNIYRFDSGIWILSLGELCFGVELWRFMTISSFVTSCSIGSTFNIGSSSLNEPLFICGSSAAKYSAFGLESLALNSDFAQLTPLYKILVIYSQITNMIIGSGTIFKIEKIHNNPVGQIEDIIINNEYRGYGLGKELIKNLVNIGLNEFKCYKIILNCLDKNIGFYEKCNFITTGIEMKYLIS